MFHDVRFPTALSFGALGGPERRTEIVTLANGFEERNTPWKHSRRRYDAGVAMQSLDDIETVLAFFEARQGQMFGFRWKDWADYRSAQKSKEISFDDQMIGFGDGIAKVHQITKTYRSGSYSYQRPVRKPVLGSVRVGVAEQELQEGIDYSVDYSTGEITFDRAPDIEAEVTAGFEFDVPVRFDSPILQASVENFQAGEVPSVSVVEIRI